MWTCVKCGANVEDEFDYCGWCGTSPDGVEDPAFAAENNKPSPVVEATAVAEARVTVATARLPEHAHTLRCHLEAAGIVVFVPNQPPGGMDWARANGGEIQLQVRDADRDRARSILAGIPPEEVVSQPAPAAAPPAAPPTGLAWQPENKASLSPKEYLRALESKVSALMDDHDTPGWKVNPAYHPEVNAFIDSHADQPTFVKSARSLQQNRAKYYATMRARNDAKAAAAAALTAPAPVVAAPTAPPEPVPEPVAAKTQPRRRWLRRSVTWTAALLLLIVVTGLGLSIYTRLTGEQDLEDAIAHTGQLDPGWYWDELQAKRAAVPEEQNAALQVETAAKELTEQWLGDETVWKKVRELPPDAPLTGEQMVQLTEALKDRRVTAALVEARDLARYSTGRYPSAPGDKEFRVAELLWLDAARLAQLRQGDDDALASGLALLVVGRAVGDDPDPKAQFVFRMKCRQLALSSIQRTLAQSEPSAMALEETQKLLESEVAQPVALCGLRGWRARTHAAMMPRLEEDSAADLMAYARDCGPESQECPLQRGVNDAGGWLTIGLFRQDYALVLDRMNAAVTAAKQPGDKQSVALREAAKVSSGEEIASEWPIIEAERSRVSGEILGELTTTVETLQRSRGELTTAVVGLAAERYRRANGRLPESLETLVSGGFLERVPADPVRLTRLDDGLVIEAPAAGKDVRFRLWDVERLPLPKEVP